MKPREKPARTRKTFHFYPFAGVALGMGALGSGLIAYFSLSETRPLAVSWFLAIWFACCLNLAVLGKAGLKVFEWMADTGQNRSPGILIELFFWGTLKFLSLILLGSLIWRSRAVPGMTLVLGLSTLFVVPLFGGYLWSRTDYARRTRI